MLVLSFVLSCREEPVLDLSVTVRNHQDVSQQPDGGLTPRYLLPDSRPGLCLEAAATTDTSRWEMHLTLAGEALGADAVPPAARMGPVLCFEGEIPIGSDPLHGAELCGRLFDRFKGTELRLPCRRVDYRPDLAYHAFRAERSRLLRAKSGVGLEAFLAELDSLARETRPVFPLSAVQLELIAVHFLREEGTPEAREEAARRLASLPVWLDRPEASGIAAEALREEALLALRPGSPDGSPAAAWRHLVHADQKALAVAYPKRFMITVSQADLLARQGALDEAIERIRAALDDCRFVRCNPALLPSAQGQLVWLLQFQKRATEAELGEAEAAARRALDRIPEHVPLERINQLLNLALLQVRRGADSGPTLLEARDLLERVTPGGEMLRARRAWADLISGLAALRAAQPSVARRLCGALEPVSDLQISALAASCEARAQRALGELRAADTAFERALLLHEVATSQRPGEGLPVGLGPQSEDFARAARVAVERGLPALAWERLERLDRLASLERQRQRCRERASDGPGQARWEQIDDESKRIRAQLRALQIPASPQRREELARLRQTLVSELRELWRRWPSCGAAPAPMRPAVSYRAVALADEILLLRRGGSGAVSTVRRTPFPRGRLRDLIDTVARADATLDDAAWRRTLASVAQALAPQETELRASVIRYSLHGPLQRVPLTALPLPAGFRPEGGEEAPRWLSDIAIPVVVPSGVGPLDPPQEEEVAPPLFAVDPLGDLPGGSELVGFYRELFPNARLLTGAAATRDGLRTALPSSAEWLHFDTHGRYQAGFPELSALELRDGPITFTELADLPILGRFVNLSGCDTGRWPITEDSGRFGVAGLLAQLGSRWVVASQGELADDLARDFNRAFYRAVAAGAAIPAAFAAGLDAVKEEHPAHAWATLMLISGAQAELEDTLDSTVSRGPLT